MYPRRIPSCRRCRQPISGVMFSPTLRAADPQPLTVRLCSPCFQEAMLLNDEELEQYLAERRQARDRGEGPPRATPAPPTGSQPACRACGISARRRMIRILLNSRGPSHILRDLCLPCFQDAFALTDAEAAYYLQDRPGEAPGGLWLLNDDL